MDWEVGRRTGGDREAWHPEGRKTAMPILVTGEVVDQARFSAHREPVQRRRPNRHLRARLAARGASGQWTGWWRWWSCPSGCVLVTRKEPGWMIGGEKARWMCEDCETLLTRGVLLASYRCDAMPKAGLRPLHFLCGENLGVFQQTWTTG